MFITEAGCDIRERALGVLDESLADLLPDDGAEWVRASSWWYAASWERAEADIHAGKTLIMSVESDEARVALVAAMFALNAHDGLLFKHDARRGRLYIRKAPKPEPVRIETEGLSREDNLAGIRDLLMESGDRYRMETYLFFIKRFSLAPEPGLFSSPPHVAVERTCGILADNLDDAELAAIHRVFATKFSAVKG